MLSAAELAAMRDTVIDAQPDSAIIYRPSGVADGQGGSVVTWSAIGTVSCARWPTMQGEEDVVGGRFAGLGSWRVAVPAGTDLRTGDRVTHAGETLEVAAVALERSFELAVVADCGLVR